MRGMYLSVYGEFGECRVVCGTQNCLQIRGKNLYLLYKNTPRDIKVCISQLIIIRILFYLHYMEWIKPKNHLPLLSLQRGAGGGAGGCIFYIQMRIPMIRFPDPDPLRNPLVQNAAFFQKIFRIIFQISKNFLTTLWTVKQIIVHEKNI
jgi:hypothetical protein